MKMTTLFYIRRRGLGPVKTTTTTTSIFRIIGKMKENGAFQLNVTVVTRKATVKKS